MAGLNPFAGMGVNTNDPNMVTPLFISFSVFHSFDLHIVPKHDELP
jgi:hypothetical protein